MADSDALRSRRRRAHASGDHHLCSSRCTARRIAAVPDDLPEDAPEPAGAGENPEPVAGLRALAKRLDQAHRENPGDAALGRCLKDVYLAIAGLEGSRDGGLEALLGDLSA